MNPPISPALAAEGGSHRRQVIDRLIAGWTKAGVLRQGMDRKSAADRLWLLTTVEGYLNAVDRLGWTRSKYEDWLVELAETELFER